MSTPASQPAWAPAIPDFDGSPLKTFPRVFFSKEEIEQARARVNKHDWAAAILKKLVQDADEALTLELRPLDESWWRTAQSQPWEQTYPPVYEHTSRRPMKYAHPAAVCALVWKLTGETRYADRACDLLLLLAPYSFEPQHFDVGMNYTGWGLELLQAYDLVGERLAPAERRQVDACMTRLGRAVLQNDVYWIEHDIGGGLNNHLAWHKMMLGFLGLFYGRPELVKFSVEGRRGMLPLLGDAVLDHGLWCESSLNYHFTAIWPMLRVADAQRRMGVRPTLLDLEAANGRTLKQTFDAMIDVLFPDGSIPPVGDTYAHRARLCDSSIYEYAWAAWQDSRYAWLLSQSKQRYQQALVTPDLPAHVTAPNIRSILLPEHGYVFLRDTSGADGYWNTNARCVFLTYDRSGVHSNADKLSMMFFGEGQLLLADREARATVPHAFSSDVQRQLNRGTLCHNVVMIDGQDQRGTSQLLRPVEYHVTPTEQRITVADAQGLLYAGVRQMRTLILTPQYVLDVFQVDCGAAERQIDWIAHPFEGASELSADLNPIVRDLRPFELPKVIPWKWLRDARSAAVQMPLVLQWTSDSLKLRLSLHTQAGASAIFCGFPESDEPAAATRSMMMLRQRAAKTVIIALWTVGRKPVEVSATQQPTPDLRYRVQWPGGSREHIIPRLEAV